MAEKKKEEVQESEDIYFRYNQNDRSDWAQHAVEDRDYKMSASWEKVDADAVRAADQMVTTDNEILPAIDLMVAMITENNPRWVFSGTEPSDTSVASAISDLHAHIWKESKGTYVNERAVTDYEDTGIGAFQVYVDPYADFGKGEIKITALDPLDVFLDPNCKMPDGSDSKHILIVKNLTEEQIKDDYPDLNLEELDWIESDGYPSSTLDKDMNQVQYPELTEIRLVRAIDRYTKIKVKRFHVFDPISQYEMTFTKEDYIEFGEQPVVIIIKAGQEKYETRPYKVRELQDIANETNGIFHEMVDPNTGEVRIMQGVEHGGSSIPGSTTQLKVTDKTELINSGVIKVDFPRISRIKRVYSIGGKEIVNETMPLEDHPIVTFMLHHQRNPYPMSDIRLVKSKQQQLCKISSLIIAYNTNITNVKMFIPKGGKLKTELETRGGKSGFQVFEFDPDTENPPFVVQLTQMSVALYEEKRQLQDEIQRIIGAYSILDGSTQNAPRTKGGTQLFDEFGQRRVALKRKRLENALNQTAKVVSQYIPRVYTEEKIIRIVEPNHQSRSTTFNQPNPEDASQIINDLSVRYDVECVSSSTLPTNKMQRFDMMNAAFQNKIITDNTAVIQYMDVPDVERLIEREDKLRQAEQLLQQADEEIKKLKGDLQTANRAEVQAEKKVEVQKFKTDLKDMGSEIKAGVTIAKARISDELKRTKETNKPNGDNNKGNK